LRGGNSAGIRAMCKGESVKVETVTVLSHSDAELTGERARPECWIRRLAETNFYNRRALNELY